MTRSTISTPRCSLWRRGGLWLLLLAPLFFITYGQVNLYTASRLNVGSLAFEWESATPFWPWTIVPYWSIDLLYGISLFVCTSQREQTRHALRLVMASLVACVGFLLFPLKFSFLRPHTDGMFGWLFEQLEMFDLPYNQAPSLHIILTWLLWLRFRPHLKGRWRWVSSLWFVLIAVSVLTTWQHHFIDVASGLLVGLCISYLVPMQTHWHWRRPGVADLRLASYYIIGSFVCTAAGLSMGFGLLNILLWPALSLLLVSFAYLGLGVSIFQKNEQGRLSLSAYLLLWPYLLGAKLSMLIFTRRMQKITEITPSVYLGCYPDKCCDGLAIFDLTAEFSHCDKLPTDSYACYPMLDLSVPGSTDLQSAVNRLNQLLQENERVLVHCALGLSRSALVVAAWLLVKNKVATPQQAVEWIAARRRHITLSAAHMQLLDNLRN